MADPYDVFAEQAALQRRQQLLQAMQSQAMQRPIQGKYGLAQALAKIGEAYLLKGGDTGLKGEQAQVTQQYQSGLQDQMAQFMRNYEGEGAIKQFGATPEAASTTAVPAQEADPRAAIIAAMTSQYPEMQMMGKTMMPGLVKQQMSPKDYLGLSGFDPDSQVAAAQGGGIPALKGKPSEHVVGGSVVVGTPSGGYKQAGNFSNQFSEPYEIPGPKGKVLVKKNLATGEVEPIDKSASVHVGVQANVMPKGETAFTEALGKDQAEAYKEIRKQAEAAYATKSMVGQLQELEKGGVFNTPVPNFAITAGRIAQAIGVPVDQTKLANSEAYQQQISKRVAEVLTMGAGVGRSMTDEDRNAFMRSLPELMATPAGRQQIYSMLSSGADQAIARHKSAQSALLQSPTMRGYEGILTLNPVDEKPGIGVLNPQVPVTPAGQGQPIVKNW